MEATAESKRYKAAVSKPRAFKGIDYLIALAVVCETGDFRRFGNAKVFTAYLGFVPREYSRGGKQNRGGITKTGNGHLRRLLTEGAWHYARSGRTGARLEQRREGCSAEVIDMADKALYRSHKKYIRAGTEGEA